MKSTYTITLDSFPVKTDDRVTVTVESDDDSFLMESVKNAIQTMKQAQGVPVQVTID